MLPSLLAALALTAPVPKAPPIDLSWKFTKGDVFYVTHVEECVISATLADGTSAEGIEVTSVGYKVVVTDADPKVTTLEVTFLAGHHSSGSDREKLKLREAPKLPGQVVKVTLDVTRAISALDGEADANKRLPHTGGLMLEVETRSRLNTLFRAVPGKPLADGAVWDVEFKDTPAEDTTITRAVRGKVSETVGGRTKLTAEVEVAETGGLDARLVMNFGCKKALQTVHFDAKSGRVQSIEESRTLTGKVHAMVGPGPIHAQITRAETTKITVSDEQPKVKK
jgi:hypothetical protein